MTMFGDVGNDETRMSYDVSLDAVTMLTVMVYDASHDE